MNVEYTYYEKNKNLEEVQALIFNENMKKYSSPGATADQIKTRYDVANFDTKGVRYAFTSDNKPLAYIQTRVEQNNKRTFIGYPWALPDCPEDVQKKMFEDMLDYIKKRDTTNKIVIGNIQQNWPEVHNFIKKYNARIDNEFKTYALEVNKMMKFENKGYSMKIAKVEDFDNLVELAKSEPNFDSAFADEQAMKNYLKEQITNNDVLLIYKDDLLVSAGALNSLEPNVNGNLNIRFTATRGYKFDFWKAFVVELSKYIADKGMKDVSFTIFDRTPEHLKFYDQYGKVASVATLYELPR